MNSYQWETRARIAKYEARKMFWQEIAGAVVFVFAIAEIGFIWALFSV
jgi:hypothetical protein